MPTSKKKGLSPPVRGTNNKLLIKRWKYSIHFGYPFRFNLEIRGRGDIWRTEQIALNVRLFGFYSPGNAEPLKVFEVRVTELDNYSKT